MAQANNDLHQSAQQLLDHAGIVFNGSQPWDIQVHNPQVYRRLLTGGSIGLGESYMDGWWDCEQMDVLFDKIIGAHIAQKLKGMAQLEIAGRLIRDSVFNRQSKTRAYQVADVHYNLGNDLFEKMLDSSMNYSCAYWKNADSLEQAQINKMELICQKLKLSPGMKVLDIGCGWGGLAKYMAEKYQVEVDGLTISKEQHALAAARNQGLPVKIRLQDYRDLSGQYDRIVSVGMFEHVGQKNYKRYFNKVSQLLTEDGLFLLHTIGSEITSSTTDGFIQKYIFPNGIIPTRGEITKPSEDILRLEDWHNFGHYYDPTLMAWLENFEAAWPELKNDYSERFYRMWRYYLCSCAGYFRCRDGQLWQLVFSHPENQAPYDSIR